MLPDARSSHAKGVTLSALPVVANRPGIYEVPAAACRPLRWLPAEGADQGTIKQRHEKTVLFLCTGNYYRSRFAEILFNSVAGKMGLPWRASSRGLALERGVNNVGPMAVVAVKALEARGHRGVADFGRFPIQATEDEDGDVRVWAERE